MFCPYDTWISAQLPDRKNFERACAPHGPPVDTPMVIALKTILQFIVLDWNFP
jgi:hypothetical protein